MTPQVAMQFMVLSYYYHDVLPEKAVSYAKCGKFPKEDVTRLDELKDMLFKCFEEDSVFNACKQFQMLKLRHKPCPFPQATLDGMFAKEAQKQSS